jgi:hypothetical protein
MRARLKALRSDDVEDLARWVPPAPDEFAIGVVLEVGALGLRGRERFELLVVTPRWLEAHHGRRGAILGRGKLVVFEWSFERLKAFLAREVERCSGRTWPEVAREVGRIVLPTRSGRRPIPHLEKLSSRRPSSTSWTVSQEIGATYVCQPQTVSLEWQSQHARRRIAFTSGGATTSASTGGLVWGTWTTCAATRKTGRTSSQRAFRMTSGASHRRVLGSIPTEGRPGDAPRAALAAAHVVELGAPEDT